MDTMVQPSLPVKRASATRQRYVAVNGAWPKPGPQLPKLEDAEAIRATRLLIAEACRYYGWKKLARAKRTFRLTSGNRQTRPRGGVWYVNPDERGQGWHEVVHSVSHWAHNRAYPTRGGHDGTHAIIERHLIEYVVNSGWLDGKLKSKAKPAPEPVDRKSLKISNAEAKLKRWQSKAKRAATAIRKLQQQIKRWRKAGAA